MASNLMSLIFIWLLSVMASNAVTPRQDLYLTKLMTSKVTGERFSHKLLTTQEVSSINPHSQVSGLKVTPPIRDDVSPTKEMTSTKPSLQTILTKTLFLNTEKTATPTNSILPPSYSSTRMMITTEEQATIIKSTRVVTSQASIPTKPTMVLPELYNSSQGQDKENINTSIFQFTTNKITHLSTYPLQSTKSISDVSTFTNTKEVKSGVLSTVTSGGVSQTTGSYKASMATPPIMTTKKMKRKETSKKENKSPDGVNHGKAVAGLIGGALLLMMVGFLVIYIKKRKLQRQTITTTDWAGPSPFLEGGADNGRGAQRSSNRISLTTILPQGLIKRLSLLPETDELEDVATGTTFRDKHHKDTLGGKLEGIDVQESNKAVAVVPEMESMRDPAEAVGSVVSTTFFPN
ncbi:protein EVI2B [Mugil cephalus]|uniref:protein EVI2B n=1 Tax=Mugil cephalus TaxID=48193 RepID=UPI001FB6D572|nr:protein EVI2B [Mugil cephalus]